MGIELKKILSELRQGFVELFGERLDGLYIYGSQARGDALPDSDIDVLVVIRGEFDYFDFLHRSDNITSSVSLAHDVVISRLFVTRDKLESSQLPFYASVRREAVAV